MSVSTSVGVGQTVTLNFSGGGKPDTVVGWINPNWNHNQPSVGQLTPSTDGLTATYKALTAGSDSIVVTDTSGGIIYQGVMKVVTQ